jgi:hypothetical protein
VRPNLKFFIAGGVIALAVGYLVLMGVQGTTVYFLTVSELQARGPAAQNQVFRVSGNLIPGTLTHESSGLGIHFQIADPISAAALPVVYRAARYRTSLGTTSRSSPKASSTHRARLRPTTYWQNVHRSSKARRLTSTTIKRRPRNG